MKKGVKLLGVFLMCVLLFVLTACGAKDTSTGNNSETQQETTQETEKEEVIEYPANVNLLTGVADLTDEAIGKRPVAVMVNNVTAAFPQYGIAQADIIFEIPVEGGATRFMAMYGDYTQVPKICSVRSCRSYFPEISEGFDAIYVYWGMGSGMQEYVDSLGLTCFNGMTNDGGLYGRDMDRKNSGYALEHTGYFDGTGLPEVIEDTEQRTDIEEDKKDPAFKFNATDNVVKPSGAACTTIKVDYGTAVATLIYDEATNTYLKQYNGNAQVDGVTGTQLAFTNVLVLECNIGPHPDGEHRDVKWIEGGNGYYVSNGAMQQITWSKDSVESRIMLFDADGNELKINAGKSYIGINYVGEATFE